MAVVNSTTAAWGDKDHNINSEVDVLNPSKPWSKGFSMRTPFTDLHSVCSNNMDECMRPGAGWIARWTDSHYIYDGHDESCMIKAIVINMGNVAIPKLSETEHHHCAARRPIRQHYHRGSCTAWDLLPGTVHLWQPAGCCAFLLCWAAI